MRTLSCLLTLAATTSLALSGCATDDCVFAGSRPIEITPATDCLFVSIAEPTSNQALAGCEAPTLVVYNGCSEAVVIPGRVTTGGQDIAIEAASTGMLLLRADLGQLIGPGLLQLLVPAAIGAAAITLVVVLVQEQERSGGSTGDDDDD